MLYWEIMAVCSEMHIVDIRFFNLIAVCSNSVKPSGYFLYHKTRYLHVSHCVCVCVFCVDLRNNTAYFPTQH